MSAWQDFKIEAGVKLYRSVCILCGAEFWTKNPYRSRCYDSTTHKDITRHKNEQAAWSKVDGRSYQVDTSGMGSWDNIVALYEDSQ